MSGLASQEPDLVNERKFVGDARDLSCQFRHLVLQHFYNSLAQPFQTRRIQIQFNNCIFCFFT